MNTTNYLPYYNDLPINNFIIKIIINTDNFETLRHIYFNKRIIPHYRNDKYYRQIQKEFEKWADNHLHNFDEIPIIDFLSNILQQSFEDCPIKLKTYKTTCDTDLSTLGLFEEIITNNNSIASYAVPDGCSMDFITNDCQNELFKRLSNFLKTMFNNYSTPDYSEELNEFFNDWLYTTDIHGYHYDTGEDIDEDTCEDIDEDTGEDKKLKILSKMLELCELNMDEGDYIFSANLLKKLHK